MNKVVVKSLIGQNGESLGAYVDYGDFCKMQSEYEEQIEKMKLERSKFVDEIIDTAKGYGLVCDSCLFSLINDYDNKRISYDELLEKLQNDVIRELKLAIDDLRNGECVE